MILQLHQTMDFKAVTLIIKDQLMDVSEIPFPAVTVFSRFPSIFKLKFPKIQSFDDFDLLAHVSMGFVDHDDDADEYPFKAFEHPTSRY